MDSSKSEGLVTKHAATPGVDPERWVEQHADCLYRYALLRVRRPEVAEDLVQETFFAAVRTFGSFRGKSSERSWLCGILKNKICDYFRKLGRETCFTDLEFPVTSYPISLCHKVFGIMIPVPSNGNLKPKS